MRAAAACCSASCEVDERCPLCCSLSRLRLELSLRRAKRHNVKYGVKLVRGAYLVQETQLAEKKGYENPIWPTIDGTHACYQACVETLMDHLPSGTEVRDCVLHCFVLRCFVLQCFVLWVHTVHGGVPQREDGALRH